MNILLNKLPSKVLTGGIEIPINTDFRTSIAFENLINKYNLENEEEQKKFYNESLELYYPIVKIDFDKANDAEKILFNHLIDHVAEAIEKMMWFYRCGKDLKTKKEKNIVKEEIYNFEYDADKIYSAFLDQYSIDLQEIEHLHWWKFKALFGALKEDNEISKVMSIRATDTSKLSKEQQEYYNKLKRLYRIPQKKEDVEHSKGLAALLRGGQELK